MEEKERFELNDNDYIIDNEKDVAICDICDVSVSLNFFFDLLNCQDKRIKELEETNKVLSNELTKNSILKQDYIETCCGISIFEIPKIKEENQQLKQQLALTEKALKLAREYMFNVMCADDVPFESWFIECAKNDWKPS